MYTPEQISRRNLLALSAGGGLLIRAIAYRMQEQMHGGLSAAVRRKLQKSINLSSGKRTRAPSSLPRVKPGSCLVREWQGTTHEVAVIEDGYIYKDKRYGSLSEVARKITGTRWSGPLFFGLRSIPSKAGSDSVARPIVTDLTSRSRRSGGGNGVGVAAGEARL